MNELETQLSELLKKAIEVAEKTGEFAIEQAPLLLQEFYMWHITRSIIFIFIGIGVFFVLRFISSLFGSKESFMWVRNKGYSFEEEEQSVLIQGKYYKRGSDKYTASLIFKYSGLFILFLLFSANMYRIIFILVAPKLYLLEYFTK